MTYDDGWEHRLCRWLSALTIFGAAGLLPILLEIERRRIHAIS